MQTLARVNRTFRGKEDGLLVAYAPLADNLQKALSEYTQQDQESKPLGRNAEEAVALTKTLMATLGELLSGFDWKAALHGGGKRPFLRAVHKTVEYVRDPATPGNRVPDGEETLAARYRKLSGQLARAWAISGGGRAPGDAAAGGAVLRRGPRLDGEVRRRRPTGPRRTAAR